LPREPPKAALPIFTRFQEAAVSEQRAVDDDERTPRRTLNKHEAIRHLIHTSVRLIMTQEDPFAVHLLVHSADKMLIDIAGKRGQELKVDWELYIKDEYHKAFFDRHRATYNYFKHADRDFSADLPVHDIMMLNVMTLFIAIENYVKLFGERTDHMMLFLVFVMNLSPEIINKEAEAKVNLQAGLRMTQSMTPKIFFECFEENSHMLPKFYSEVSKDMQDIIDFYHLSFSQLRAGETKSPKLLRIPE
jgi:hypothetical protein